VVQYFFSISSGIVTEKNLCIYILTIGKKTRLKYSASSFLKGSILNNSRLEAFLNLLTSIYGSKVVASLTDCVNDNYLKLKKPEKIKEFLAKYNRTADEGCQNCQELVPKRSFLERRMDFPSWKGLLNFEKKHVKQLMIIGEDVSPIAPYVLNVAYGLGRYDISEDGVVKAKEEKRNKLWVHLEAIFDGNLDLVLKNVYVTDISKCNVKTKQKKHKKNLWDKCSKNFLLREMELINPKVVIFQGRTAYEYTKSIHSLKMKEEDITSYFGNNFFPKFGKIALSKNEMKFMRIYHTSNANQCYNHLNKKEGFKKLVKDRVMPLLESYPTTK
jgi:uracil-DNA glycosylase family 4